METGRNAPPQWGRVGEKVAAAYLERHGFTVMDRNVARKTGELDIVARRDGLVHVIEVKALVCRDLPQAATQSGVQGRARGAYQVSYHPAFNLHPGKLRKVVRTAEWYLKDIRWEGEWQVDGVLVWLCPSERVARAEYLPRIV